MTRTPRSGGRDRQQSHRISGTAGRNGRTGRHSIPRIKKPRSLNRLAIILVVLSAACAGPSRNGRLDSLVGQDVALAIETLGKPAEVVSLVEGRHAYVWRREYRSKVSPQSPIWPERRLEGWDPDPDRPIRFRVCLTSLLVGFDFVVEQWERECRYETEDRR